LKYYPGIFLEDLWKKYKNLRITGILVEIRTKYISNTSLSVNAMQSGYVGMA
jgi:hypothetical protein